MIYLFLLTIYIIFINYFIHPNQYWSVSSLQLIAITESLIFLYLTVYNKLSFVCRDLMTCGVRLKEKLALTKTILTVIAFLSENCKIKISKCFEYFVIYIPFWTKLNATFLGRTSHWQGTTEINDYTICSHLSCAPKTLDLS